ncbi:MAG: hypothetical protein ACRELE_11390 [Gemmatimonadales bacterium]
MAVLVLMPPGCAAQAPSESAVLSAWNDSLYAATSEHLPRLDADSRTGHGDVGAMRRALFRLRQAEVRNDRHELEAALMALDLVGAAHRRWAWPSYAMADGYAYLARKHAPLLPLSDQYEGESHADAVWRNLADALRNDAELAPARRLATDLMVAGGDRELMRTERGILATLLRHGPAEPDVLLVEARDLRTRLAYDSALRVFDLSATRGGDRSRLSLERARTLAALGDSAASEDAYWGGLAQLTSTGREMYRFDLAWIVSPDSLATFDKVPDDALAGWLRRFWAERDAAAANLPGERLADHLQREVFVYAQYRVDRPWRHTQMTRVEYLFEDMTPCVKSDAALYDLLAREAPVHAGDIRDHEPLLDHRGLIYLKHGRPWRTLSEPVALLAANDADARSDADAIGVAHRRGPGNPIAESDSWLYWFEGDWRLLHFRGSNALGLFRPTTLSGYLPVDPAFYASRAAMLPAYADAAQTLAGWEMSRVRRQGAASCLDEVVAAIRKSRDDAHTAAAGDSDTPIIALPWTSAIQVFGLGHGDDHSGKLLLSFAFSGDALRAVLDAHGQLAFSIHFRVIAFNRVTGESVTLDTTRMFRAPDQLRPGQSLTGWLELPVTGGTWQVAMRANEGAGSAGAYMLHRDVVVDAGSALSLSDIVTGQDGAASWWATDGASFPLNVLDAWASGGTARLFYEVRGLHLGDVYQTVVELAPVGSGGKTAVRLVTTDRAAGSVDYVRKSLGLEQLKPGKYHLSVMVSQGSQRAVRGRDLVIGKSR